ncbi:hypothetical protein DAMA08_039570 [Martiniozyma asiatica (nom. inval.)]|nr:hypothetical protein DAMA08_039570 [Martiniozyma asiatica]
MSLKPETLNKIIETSFKKGNELFKYKNYENSFKYYQRAVDTIVCRSRELKKSLGKEHHDARLVTLLDCCCASLQKTGDLTQAEKNAITMIELEPFTCKGYLRAIKVYRQLNKLDTAYSIACKGYTKIKKKKSADKNFKLNIVQYGKLKQEVISLKMPTPSVGQVSYNPMDKFPLEIIQLIIAQLEFKDKINCFYVCKSWYKVMSNSFQLFQDFSILKNLKKSQFEKFMKFINKNNNFNNTFLNNFTLQPIPSAEKFIIKELFNRKIRIKSLNILLKETHSSELLAHIEKSDMSFKESISSLTLELPIYESNSQSVRKIYHFFPNLTKLSIHVRRFDLRSIMCTHSASYELNKLEFFFLSFGQEAENHSLSGSFIHSLLGNVRMSNLKEFTMIGGNPLNYEYMQTIPATINKLKMIKVSGFTLDDFLTYILEAESYLGCLDSIKIVEKNTKVKRTIESWNEEDLITKGVFVNLTSFLLRDSQMTPRVFHKILRSVGERIKDFHIMNNYNLIFKKSELPGEHAPYGFVDIRKMILAIPHVENLSIVSVPGFSNKSINMISSVVSEIGHPKIIKSLNLTMNKINGDGIFTLLKIFKKISTLNISFCEVSPHDAETIRSMKHVETLIYKMSDKVQL